MLKFSSKAIPEHAEVPLADDGRWEKIVAHWDARRARRAGGRARTAGRASSCRSVRCAIRWCGRRSWRRSSALVQSQGGRVVGQEICHLVRSQSADAPRKGHRGGDGSRGASQRRHDARARRGALAVADAEPRGHGGHPDLRPRGDHPQCLPPAREDAAGEDPGRDRPARVPPAANSRRGTRHGSTDRRHGARPRSRRDGFGADGAKARWPARRAQEGAAEARDVGQHAAPAARRV